MPDVTPETESGRALLNGLTPVTRDAYRPIVLAIEKEAASAAVAEVLDRLEPLLTPFPNEAIRALIASEREP